LRARTIAYAFYLVITLIISMTIAFIPPLIILGGTFHNIDVSLGTFGWPFEPIRLFAESLGSEFLPLFFFEHFWFFILLIPIVLFCYGVLLGILVVMFKISRRGIPYLENGTYPSDTEEWLLYEFYEVYYRIFRHFQWFFSVFLESSLVHQLFGAKIGKGTVIGGGLLPTPDRTIIGENCFIGYGSILGGNVYEGDRLYLNTIKIGDNVTIGGYAIVLAGSKIGDNVIIGANTVVPKDRVIPPNTIWVHGKSIPRRDLEWNEEEYKALAEEFNDK